jgi:hypothetical protein
MSPEQFWASAERQGGCLIWRKSLRRNGYGQLKIDGRNRTAHRVAYELAVGAIPDGAEIDHCCRRRACIDPAHLRLATHKQNNENRTDRPVGTSSGVRGVYWDRSRARWSARLTHNYRAIFLGRFDDLADAERAVVAARAAYFTHAN